MESANPTLPKKNLQAELGNLSDAKTKQMLGVVCPTQKVEGEVGEVRTENAEDRNEARLLAVKGRVREAIEMISCKKGGSIAQATVASLAESFGADLLRDIFGELDDAPDSEWLGKLTELFRELIDRVGYEFRQEAIRDAIKSGISVTSEKREETPTVDDQPRERPRKRGKGGNRK